MSDNLLDIDTTFARLYIPKAVLRGYHAWSVYYVGLMRRSPLALGLAVPIAIWRNKEIAYQFGATKKGCWQGKLVRWIGESLCWVIGQFVADREWKQLFKKETLA